MEVYGNFFVYALINPETKRVFYVGRSKNADTRLGQHIKESISYKNSQKTSVEKLFGIDPEDVFERNMPFEKSNVNKIRAINNILTRGLKPELKILDEWYAENIQDANRLEEAWIAEMRRIGEPLTNFILSRRMEVWFYSKDRSGWKPGYATSPKEYIEKLKAGEIHKTINANNFKSKVNARKSYNRKKLAQIAKKLNNRAKKAVKKN